MFKNTKNEFSLSQFDHQSKRNPKTYEKEIKKPNKAPNHSLECILIRSQSASF